jgi:hypothetical protein
LNRDDTAFSPRRSALRSPATSAGEEEHNDHDGTASITTAGVDARRARRVVVVKDGVVIVED